MNTVTYSIPNISCGHCVHTIQSEVGDLAGVQSVVASLDGKQATITSAPRHRRPDQGPPGGDQLSSPELICRRLDTQIAQVIVLHL